MKECKSQNQRGKTPQDLATEKKLVAAGILLESSAIRKEAEGAVSLDPIGNSSQSKEPVKSPEKNSPTKLLGKNKIGVMPDAVIQDNNSFEHLIELGPDNLNEHGPPIGIELNIEHRPGPSRLDSSTGHGIKNNSENVGPPLEGHSQQTRTKNPDHTKEHQFAQFQEELFASTAKEKKCRVKSIKGSDQKATTTIGDKLKARRGDNFRFGRGKRLFASRKLRCRNSMFRLLASATVSIFVSSCGFVIFGLFSLLLQLCG
ncbi:hypothetical protein L6452_30746 [Arctium lappa]|uniref:Uncharacterized protein n=1 Tax=Arctium lappa TaxID=4217 RepID=A0ACB8ZJH2_ARCLA|nr:hypothetical protein L6452_30746 [Arctium lappa]